MKLKKFKQLCKEDTRKHIIFLYIAGKIFLNGKQLDKVLEMEW